MRLFLCLSLSLSLTLSLSVLCFYFILPLLFLLFSISLWPCLSLSPFSLSLWLRRSVGWLVGQLVS